MRKIMMWVIAFAALLPGLAVASGTDSGRKAIQVASTSVVVPSVANVTGVTGSVFRSRISLFNPTAFTYPIRATFHDPAGNMSNVNITMAAGQMRVYDNFLGDVFSTTGAGSVRFESRLIAGRKPEFSVCRQCRGLDRCQQRPLRHQRHHAHRRRFNFRRLQRRCSRGFRLSVERWML